MSKRDTLYFVGFIGFTKDADELDENIKEDIWNIDNKLVEQLSGNSNIVGYFSAEQLDGYNWGNLVVCKSSDAIKEWMTSKTHTTAITWVLKCMYMKYYIVIKDSVFPALMSVYSQRTIICFDYHKHHTYETFWHRIFFSFED